MSIIAVAYVMINADGDEYIFNIGAFEEDGYEQLRDLIYEYNLLPGVTLVKMSDLPGGVWLGWVKIDGVWTDPYQPEPEPEPEQPA